MTWDNRYERLFITKKDFIPLNTQIIFNEDTREFELNGTIVSAKDPNYFCDASWTVAYSPLTESWVSFYSFKPDFYIEQETWFQSGINTQPGIWNHLLTNKSYQVFYGECAPFIIEPITSSDVKTKTFSSVAYRADVLKYSNNYDWVSTENITFTRANIYNTTCSSGELELIVKDKTKLNEGLFAQQGNDSISIPVSALNGIWRFNKVSDVVINEEPIFNFECNNIDKSINPDAVDYAKPFTMMNRERLKGDWFKIRLTNDKHSKYKYVFKWLITQTDSTR